MSLYSLVSRNLLVSLNIFQHRVSTLKTKGTFSGNVQPIQLAFNQIPGDTKQYPLVIMHGLFGNKNNWATVGKLVQEKTKRTIVSLDLRNHGRSKHTPEHNYFCMVEDLRYTMEKLNIKLFSLLGHSMGGKTAMLFALTYPHMVENLIIADISPVYVSPQLTSMNKIFTALESVVFPETDRLYDCRRSVIKQLSRFIESSEVNAFLASNVIKDDNNRWAINISVLKKNFHNICEFPKSDKIYDGKTLFIGGEASDFIPTDSHEGIYKIFPNSKIIYISNAGHWLHVDQPQAFVDICSDFLQN